MKKLVFLIVAIWVSLSLPMADGTALAQSPAERPTSQPGASSQTVSPSVSLSVAVLDFAADTPGQPDLGKQIGEALAIMLSGEPGFRLVDRSLLARILQEHELNLSGVVETEQAIKIGRLIGAKILVAGKVFALGENLFMTAKLIGTETSLVDGVMVKGPVSANVGDMMMDLSVKLAKRLHEVGPHLVAQDDAGQDPLPGLKARLAKTHVPIVAVVIPEQHMNNRPLAVPDPAVETEIKRLLRECGITIKDVPQNELASFARLVAKDGSTPWPRGLDGVECVIVGEGLSEFASRIGNLVNCVARAEINVISRGSGNVELAERTTERSVDLSENIAGKKALEKAGRTLGLRVLEHFAGTPQSASAPSKNEKAP